MEAKSMTNLYDKLHKFKFFQRLALLCDCPGAEPGKINIEILAHLPECWIRKRLATKAFTIDTSVTLSSEYIGGYGLGVALTS
jgi:hypothetical protein